MLCCCTPNSTLQPERATGHPACRNAATTQNRAHAKPQRLAAQCAVGDMPPHPQPHPLHAVMQALLRLLPETSCLLTVELHASTTRHDNTLQAKQTGVRNNLPRRSCSCRLPHHSRSTTLSCSAHTLPPDKVGHAAAPHFSPTSQQAQLWPLQALTQALAPLASILAMLGLQSPRPILTAMLSLIVAAYTSPAGHCRHTIAGSGGKRVVRVLSHASKPMQMPPTGSN